MLPVLLIGAYFPPDGEVGGRRILKLCEHLPALEVSPSVLTLPAPAASLDPLPEDYLSGVKVHRVAAWPDPALLMARLARCFVGSRKQPLFPEKPTAEAAAETTAQSFSWRSQILAALYMPDMFIRWYWPATRAGWQICQNNGIKALVSSGPPWTCHLIARRLKRKLGVPWIADFRDPWTTRSYRLPKWRENRDRALERSCIAEADVIVCNTERIRQLYAAEYPQQPASKFVTITNGFEPSQPRCSPRNNTRRLILHLGTIYGSRRIDTFCQALQLLVENGSIDRDEVQVVFLGDVGPGHITAAEQAAPELFASQTITFQPRLPWEEAQKLLWAADVHLIIQGKYRLQVPAKFFECLQTGSPILAIADQGALTDAITETGAGFCAESDDVSQIAEALMRALAAQVQTPVEVHRRTERFHWVSIAAQFAAVIKEVSRVSNQSNSKIIYSGVGQSDEEFS